MKAPQIKVCGAFCFLVVCFGPTRNGTIKTVFDINQEPVDEVQPYQGAITLCD